MTDRQAFEVAAYAYYRERHTAGQCVDSDQLPMAQPDLLWRQEDDTYGVLMFNAAWWGWQQGVEAQRAAAPSYGDYPMLVLGVALSEKDMHAVHEYANALWKLARERVVKWQPIATAPKDNKRLLYLAYIGADGKMLHLDFDGVWEYWEESWEMAHINGWTWCSANGIEDPTHWAYQDEPIPATK